MRPISVSDNVAELKATSGLENFPEDIWKFEKKNLQEKNDGDPLIVSNLRFLMKKKTKNNKF